MISQLASVFSSQGVLLPGTELVPFPIRRKASAPDEIPSSFPAHFDQASAKLELSERALKAAQAVQAAKEGKEAEKYGEGSNPEATPHAATAKGADGRALTPEEQKQVEKLKQRDREVRAHEQAHVASAGGHAEGGAHYEYQVGPDDRQYAVGGHVNIDVGPVSGNPQATLQKAMAVRRAATAPSEPSGADMAVAAAAAQMAAQAGRDLAKDGAGKAGQGKEAAGSGRSNPYAQTRNETGRALNLVA